MGAVLASYIVGKAAEILQDAAGVRWPESDCLEWLNAGLRQIVALRPEAYVINESVQMAAGTKQTLPTGGLTFVDMTRNMGTDGETPGRTVRFIDRALIDAQNPNWHADSASAKIIHYTFGKSDPDRYYV